MILQIQLKQSQNLNFIAKIINCLLWIEQESFPSDEYNFALQKWVSAFHFLETKFFTSYVLIKNFVYRYILN